MKDSDAQDGATDKMKRAADKVDEKLEPDEEQGNQAGGPPGASSPFSSGERPDEQRTSDEPSGGVG